MSNEEKTKRANRVLHFIASSALIVAPIAGVACGGSNAKTNTAPEGSNVDHTDEPHTNVGPEDEMEEAGEEMEDAAEDTGDAVEDAAEETGDAVEDAAEEVEEETD